MGRPRRKLGVHQAAVTALGLAALVSAVSCGGGSVGDLLLGPGDFPGLTVTERVSQVTETAQGQETAQVEIEGPDFLLSESLVVFESKEAARSVLIGIKEDQSAQGIPPADIEKFEDVSGILSEVRDGQESLSIFFVQGRTLVRVTVSGPNRRALLPLYAEKAKAKISP